MKKLISLLLAVSVMAMSTVASAAYLGTSYDETYTQRNPGDWSDTTGGRNSKSLRDYSNNPKQLAVYRPGDTITITKGDQTFAAGDVVTMISSHIDATDYNSATVMFIDQITVDTNKPTFEYKIREGLAEGIYKIDIKIGSAEVDSFYYAIGDPKVEILTLENGDQSLTHNDVTYYFATAQIGTGDVMYEQAGVAGFGFDFGKGNVFTFDAATFDAAAKDQEVGGASNWFFSIGITGIGEEDTLPVAKGIIVDEE